MTKAFYGPEGSLEDNFRLSPAPIINISTEFLYSNDSIIGYIYKLSLEGYCSNYRKIDSSVDSSDDPTYHEKSIQKVLGGMELVRKLLSRNGSNFTVQSDDNVTMIKAKGGTLRSLSFEETDNAWSVYSKYSAEIDFNELELLGANQSCSAADFDSASMNSLLIDINNHKIKSFTDGWNFSITDQSFDYVRNIDTGSDLAIHNMVINASYNINVTGQNYYISDQLIPAHEQARLFAQKRLYDRVAQLVSGGNSQIFKITTGVNGPACGSDTLNTIHQPGNGILGSITYLPHNENLQCSISESDGSFSANYSCILKSQANGMSYSAPSVIHTVTKSKTKNRESNNKTSYSISVDGTIQGLVLGGLIYTAGNFSMPSSGSFLIRSSDSINKFSSASSFYANVGSEEDLSDNYKNILSITYNNLNINTANNNCENNPLPPTPRPSSFNLTRNYIDGTINYSAEYSTNNACNRDDETIQSISITTENPVAVLAEFIVPKKGTIIQDLKTVTAKKININIEGKKPRSCCPDINAMMQQVSCELGAVMPTGVSLPNPDQYILTQKQRTDNKTEGTYSISLSYICAPGCGI